MNRKERRRMEKQLGIRKLRSSLPLSQKFETIRNNIEQGKSLQIQMKEVRRVQEEGEKDKMESERISSIATDLMINKGLSFVEAQEEAKRIFLEEKINK